MPSRSGSPAVANSTGCSPRWPKSPDVFTAGLQPSRPVLLPFLHPRTAARRIRHSLDRLAARSASQARRRRWIVKDLAQFAIPRPATLSVAAGVWHSSRRTWASRNSAPKDRRLLHSVLSKQRLMELKLGSHP